MIRALTDHPRTPDSRSGRRQQNRRANCYFRNLTALSERNHTLLVGQEPPRPALLPLCVCGRQEGSGLGASGQLSGQAVVSYPRRPIDPP